MKNLFENWNMEEQNEEWTKNWQMAMKINKNLMDYSGKVMNNHMHTLSALMHNCVESFTNIFNTHNQHEAHHQRNNLMKNCIQQVAANAHQLAEMSRDFCKDLEASMNHHATKSAVGGSVNHTESANGSFNAKAAK